MRGDEIHQAEVEHLDMRQARDLPRLMQRAGCFDQYMHGNLAGDAVAYPQIVERIDLCRGIFCIFRFGQYDIGDALPGAPDDGFEFVAPGRVAGIVDTHADATKAVGIRQDQVGDHGRVLVLLASRSAIFAIGGDVEHRPSIDRQFGLNLERLVQQFFAAGKVFTGGKPGKRPVACVEYVGWMDEVIQLRIPRSGRSGITGFRPVSRPARRCRLS